ncbi:hypothetical protein DH2020_031058 [Rehmannia glutinosa]|uniref:SWIM-type domain-containing protein n=1 Tax=Rehmannia glutinosa TaxID=99300 RepID=A0ABR0VKU2_REHGL
MEEKLRKSHEKSKKFTVEPIDQSLYVVRSGATNFTVNFAENTCTCRKFQLDHLPCEHAIAAAKKRGFSIYPMCSPSIPLTIGGKHMRRLSSHVPNENEWEIPDNIKEMIVLPPIVRQRGGRRRTVRIPSTGEFRSRQKCKRYASHRESNNPLMLQPIGWTIEKKRNGSMSILIVTSLLSYRPSNRKWNSLLRLAAFDLGAHFKKHFSLGRLKVDSIVRTKFESFVRFIKTPGVTYDRENNIETIEQRFFRTNGFKYFKIAHNIFVESNATPVDLSNEYGYHPDNPVYLNSVYDGDVPPGFDPLPRGLWIGSLGGDGAGPSRVDGGDGAGPSGVDADEDVEPGGLP